MNRLSALTAVTVLALGLTGGTALAQEISFTAHQFAPGFETIEIDEAGASRGDMRAFDARFSTDDGQEGRLTGLLITVAVPEADGEFEDRIGHLVFHFGPGDSIVVAGGSVYPAEADEMAVAQPQVRAIVGGTGRYIGARGQVTTTRNDDGTFDHAFVLL